MCSLTLYSKLISAYSLNILSKWQWCVFGVHYTTAYAYEVQKCYGRRSDLEGVMMGEHLTPELRQVIRFLDVVYSLLSGASAYHSFIHTFGPPPVRGMQQSDQCNFNCSRGCNYVDEQQTIWHHQSYRLAVGKTLD